VQAIASAAPDAKMADYGCPKGTNLRDEITRYFRIAQAHWQTFNRLADPTTTQTAAFAKGLLEQAFGFALNGPHVHHREDRRFTIAWEAKGGRVPIVVAPPAPLVKGVPGDGFARAMPEFGDGESGRIHRRSPTVLLQDWLNANDAALWGLVFAGDRLRLMRDNASLTRPAWIEVDLAAIFRDDMFADFTALWLLIHTSRFGAEGAAQSDSWLNAGAKPVCAPAQPRVIACASTWRTPCWRWAKAFSTPIRPSAPGSTATNCPCRICSSRCCASSIG
jgi:hypothetical protein